MLGWQRDEWLTERLGKPAFHASPDADALSLPQGPAFVSAKIPVSDFAGLARLQELGFRLMDTNMQLARDAAPLPLPPTGIETRFAQAGDRNGIRMIAASAFVHDRFHCDPQIGTERASRIKADWADNFFRGYRGDWMVVAGAPGEPQAFLQLLRGPDSAVIIDLVAVAPGRQGAGLASAMIGFAAKTCLERGAPMRAGTQIANTASLALYAKLGFRIVSASYVLHLHL